MEEIRNEGIIIADPYNEKHIEQIKEFEQKLATNLPVKTSKILESIKTHMTEQEYKMKNMMSNVIAENAFYQEDGELKSSCYLEWNKNLKTVELTIMTPPCYKNKGYASKLLMCLEEKLFQNDDVERLEMTISKNNAASLHLAKKQGFHFDEDYEVYLTFVKENPYLKERDRSK